jgi:hypothetical protein
MGIFQEKGYRALNYRKMRKQFNKQLLFVTAAYDTYNPPQQSKQKSFQ